VLREQDASTDDFDYVEVSSVLERKLRESGEPSDEQRKASFAEIAALQMQLMDEQKRSKWGTRFAPAEEVTLQDGRSYCYPDIANIDTAVIQYWSQRAAEVQHPAFKARYADVLWDLTKAAIGGNPSIDLARQAIDGYIECGKKFPNTDTAENRL